MTKLAVFTPLPPTKSGIADYAAELLPALTRYFELSVVVSDEEKTAGPLNSDFPIYSISEWLSNSLRDKDHFRLYQQGNNRCHAHVFREAHKVPGVLVLHDFVQHHLICDLSCAKGDWDEYTRHLIHDHGALGRRISERRQLGLYSEYENFLAPLNGTLLDSSLGVVVHSQYALDQIRGLRPRLSATRIPLFASPPPAGSQIDSRQRARERLGIPTDAFVVSTLGFATPPKQIPLLLDALGRIRQEIPNLIVNIVGEVHPNYPLDYSARKNGLSECLITPGYTPLHIFYDHMQAADLIVNLRFPSAGETSATLVRALSMRRCAIVFDYGPFADYPEGVTVKIPLNTNNPRELADAILKLFKEPGLRTRYEENAGDFVAREHSLCLCACRLAQFVEDCARVRYVAVAPLQRSSKIGHKPAFSLKECEKLIGQEYEVFQVDGKSVSLSDVHLRQHLERCCYLMSHVPSGSQQTRLLELGSCLVPTVVYKTQLKFTEVVCAACDPIDRRLRVTKRVRTASGSHDFLVYRFNLEHDHFPIESRSFDVVLVCELIQQLSNNPIFMLKEINRILKFDGLLIFTTRSIAISPTAQSSILGEHTRSKLKYGLGQSTHRSSIVYTRDAVHRQVEAAGFRVETLENHDCYSPNRSKPVARLGSQGREKDFRSEMLLLVGRKLSGVIAMPTKGFGVLASGARALR